jgi:RES domain-containing protein
LALAALEYFVNLDASQAPDGLVSIEVEIPDSVKVERTDTAALPSNWRDYPHPAELPLIGEAWLKAGSSVCLMVPSAVIAEEQNLLINPLDPDFRTLLFSPPQPFQFDARMWK